LKDPETYQQLSDALQSGQGWKGEVINQKKNGESYWEEISLSTVTDGKGELLYFIAVEHDVTERKRMEENLKTSEEKFRLISSSAQDGIILVDNYNKVIYWNPAAEKILGYSSAEALSKDIYDLIAPPHNRDQYRAVMGDYLHPDNPTKTGKISEMEMIKKGGALIIIEVSVAAMELPSGFGAVGIIRDISARKRAEAELIAAKTKAEESDRLKSAFLATMSHELRTPLNSIMGFSSLINREMPPEEIEEMASLIYNGGANLLKIIESVFDVAILQSKGMSLSVSEFPVTDLFASLNQYLAAEISKEGKVRIETIYLPDGEVSRLLLKTDRVLLMQLLTNLFNNAVKYTEAGKIEYGYTRNGQDITFFVRDTGIGIPTGKNSFIFDQFRQVEDAHTRKYGGVGLGLTICREIGQLLGGTFRVESLMGEGSTFYFTLPGALLEIEKTESSLPESPNINLTGRKILVAEDIESNFELIRMMLRPTQVDLLWARDGEEAVALVKANDDLDLILMDMRMPGKDGYVATQEIKLMKPHLPVIAQTAYALQNEREKIFEIGRNDCISKPFNRQTLINTITKHLKP
jgi:PAS domain S-box-containing protein